MKSFKNFVADVILDSMVRIRSANPRGPTYTHRLTTLRVIFPRIVLSEFNTHRLLSRNSASSRAIPVWKMIQSVLENPFIPDRFPKQHKGMQAPDDAWHLEGTSGYNRAYVLWLHARDHAVDIASELSVNADKGDLVSKQIANRLLEPFLMHQVIVTASEWKNFFGLRAHPAAQREIQIIASLMRDAMNESTPTELQANQWHVPFGDKFELDRLVAVVQNNSDKVNSADELSRTVAVARCARISYNDFEGKDDYSKDLGLYYQLLNERHFSPFEHVARAMGTHNYWLYSHTTPKDVQYGWCGNFRGFEQLRKTFPFEVETRDDPLLIDPL